MSPRDIVSYGAAAAIVILAVGFAIGLVIEWWGDARGG